MATTPPPYLPQIRLFRDWLARERGLRFDSYDALWRWSTTELDAFWQSIWDYFDLRSPTPHTAVLEKNVMPGARWFAGAQINYAQQVFRHVEAAHAAGCPAVISDNEKCHDPGSDVHRLRDAGIAVKMDDHHGRGRSDPGINGHMHHKFAIFDGTRLLDGSYNWTRGAANDNEENIIDTGDLRLVAAFQQRFDALWEKF